MGNRGTLWQNKLRSGLLTDITFDQDQSQYFETVENLSINSTGMTVSLFLDITDKTINHFFEYGNNSMWFDSGGGLRVQVRTTADTTQNIVILNSVSVTDLIVDKKVHLLMIWNENYDVQLYLNSKFISFFNFSVSGVKVEENDLVAIGKRLTTYAEGNYSNLMIFDKVLDQGEISYIYNTGQIHSSMQENCIAHYPMNEAFAYIADADFVTKYSGFSTNDLVLFDVVSNYNRNKTTGATNNHLKAYNFSTSELIQSTSIEDFYGKTPANNKAWTSFFSNIGVIENLSSDAVTGDYLDPDTDFTIFSHLSVGFEDLIRFNFSGGGSFIYDLINGSNRMNNSYRTFTSFRMNVNNDTEDDFSLLSHDFSSNPDYIVSYQPRNSASIGKGLYHTLRYDATGDTLYSRYDLPSYNFTDEESFTGITATSDLTSATLDLFRYFQYHRLTFANEYISDENLRSLILENNYVFNNIKADFRPNISGNTMLDITSGNTLSFFNSFGNYTGITTNNYIWYNDTRLGGLRPFIREYLRFDSSGQTITNLVAGSAITSNNISVLISFKLDDDAIYSGSSQNDFLAWDNGSEVTRLYSKSDGGIYVSNASEYELLASGDTKNRIITLVMTNELTTTGSSVNNIYENGVLLSTSNNSTIDNFSGATLELKGYEGENFDVIALGVYDGILTRDEIITYSSYSNLISPNLYRDTDWLAYYVFSDGDIYNAIGANYISNLADRKVLRLEDSGLYQGSGWSQFDNIGNIRSFSNNIMSVNTTGETGTTRLGGDALVSMASTNDIYCSLEIDNFVSGSSGGTVTLIFGLSGDSISITGNGIYTLTGQWSDGNTLTVVNFLLDPDVRFDVNRIRLYGEFNDPQITGFSGATVLDQFNTIKANIGDVNQLR